MTLVEQEQAPLRIYLAAPWVDRESARAAGELIEQAGFAITEKWWDHTDTADPDELREQAFLDVAGVMNAEVFLVLNTQKSEGKAVEFGMALTIGTPCVIVGEPSNLFHHLVPCVPTLEDALLMIERSLESE